jgi:hypothetical protein
MLYNCAYSDKNLVADPLLYIFILTEQMNEEWVKS